MHPITWIAFGPAGPRGWKDEYNERVTTRNSDGKNTKVSFTAETILRDHRGLPVYNPLNEWNYGNRATAISGGAAHLTSPPNTVALVGLHIMHKTTLRPSCIHAYRSPERLRDNDIY